jgi:hypothetical protein
MMYLPHLLVGPMLELLARGAATAHFGHVTEGGPRMAKRAHG